MGLLSHLLFPWGLLLQGFAIIHFIRRRPDIYWIYIILFLGPLGALIYIFVEAVPDIGLIRQSFKAFPRRKRISELETIVRDNPSSGNYEELGDLYMADGRLQLARAAFDKAIAARADTLDPFYRRGVCALLLGDAAGALPDLERVVSKEPDYDFPSLGRIACPRLRADGTKRKSRCTLPARNRKIDVVGDVLEFRGHACVRGTQCRTSAPKGRQALQSSKT
jgi:hypothetical protein